MRFLILLLFSINCIASEVNEIYMNHDGHLRSYLKYIPESVNIEKPTDIFIGIHGYTGTASGFQKETTGGFNKSADKYNFITIYPQGLFFNPDLKNQNSFISSWNDLVGSRTKSPAGEICANDADKYPKYPGCTEGGRCSWTSCTDDIGFIKKIITHLNKDINIRDIYVLGMSNGGMMAQSLACNSPELFKAVINIVGMQHIGLSCIPDRPVNFIIYGGFHDNTVPPINIKSSDGYFYEPMNNTFNSWSKKFKCKTYSKNNYVYFDTFLKNQSSDCSDNVKVISILNMDRGHLWPGIDKRSGYCITDDQSNISYPECKSKVVNSWGNDFLIEILYKL
jgi:polyhydroxybutyrate depolymerase